MGFENSSLGIRSVGMCGMSAAMYIKSVVIGLKRGRMHLDMVR